MFTPKISIGINGQENDIMGLFYRSDELSWGNVYSGKNIEFIRK